MKEARLYRWDNYKLFLILCVVIGHIGNYYAASSPLVAKAQFWVYLFHMPAFILVAGLFSKKTVKESRWNRAVPYILIYILMKTLEYFAMVVIYGFDKVSFDIFEASGVPWYALAMFYFIAVTILVRKVRPAYVLAASIAVALISGYVGNLGSFLALRRAVVFYPFFYIGCVLDTEKAGRFLGKIWVKIVGALIVAGSLVFVYFKHSDISFWRDLFRGSFAYSEIQGAPEPILGFLWRAAFYIVALIMTAATASLMPNFRSYLSSAGGRTLPVFVLHYPIIEVVFAKAVRFKEWFSSGHIAIHTLLFALVLVFVLSAPYVFDYPIRKIMKVPERKEQ